MDPLLHEKLREAAEGENYDCSILTNSGVLIRSCSDEEMIALADEIEQDYTPKRDLPKITNEEWLENLDIGDALELFDALFYHIDNNFSELNLTYLAEETWKKLLNEYSDYGRRVYEEYASEIRGKEWRKIKGWGGVNPYALTTFDPAGPRSTFLPQSILEDDLEGRDA